MKRTLWLNIGSVMFVCLLIFGWHLLSSSGRVPSVFLPTPAKTWNALIGGLSGNKLPGDLGDTLYRMAVGWLLASFLAIVVGSTISLTPALIPYVMPTLEYLRPLPASATIPLFIVLLGLSDRMVLAVVVFGAVWPTLLSTISGFRSVEPRLYEVGRCFGLSKTQVILRLALPSALPEILVGLRLSLTVALILTIVCEMLASTGGLGSWVLSAGRMFRADNLFAGVVLLGLIGLSGSWLLTLIERRLLSWKTKT